MKAYCITSFDVPAAVLEQVMPAPAAGEVRIAVGAVGLNFADLLMAEGRYQDTPKPPFALGLEAAGVVEAVGPGVSVFQPGDRVATYPGHGALSEYICVAAERCLRVPPAMPLAEAAGFQIAYGTSHLALTQRARLRPGETLLVTGASGGVGLTAVELGGLLGARVIAAARGPEKLAIAQAAGADHLVDTTTEDLREAVLGLGGADVIYETVGGASFKDGMRACNPLGRMLAIGFASGEVPQVPANHLLVKNVDVIGLYWGGYLRFRPDLLDASLYELLRFYEDGRLKPHVSHILPFDRVEEGLELLRSRKATGKVVIDMLA